MLRRFSASYSGEDREIRNLKIEARNFSLKEIQEKIVA